MEAFPFFSKPDPGDAVPPRRDTPFPPFPIPSFHPALQIGQLRMLRTGENSLKALAKGFSRPFVQPSKGAGKKAGETFENFIDFHRF
jgi:hypothetical protein